MSVAIAVTRAASVSAEADQAAVHVRDAHARRAQAVAIEARP